MDVRQMALFIVWHAAQNKQTHKKNEKKERKKERDRQTRQTERERESETRRKEIIPLNQCSGVLVICCSNLGLERKYLDK